MKLSFQELTDVNEAQALYSRSAHKTFYSDPRLLSSINHSIRFFKILNGKETIFLFNFVDKSFYLPHIYYYSLTEVKWDSEQNSSNCIDNFISVVKFICDNIISGERCCDISFPTKVKDIRGILWSDLFINTGNNLSIISRYTHLIDLTKINNVEALKAKFRSSRRQEIRYAVDREKLSISGTSNIQILKDLYIRTLNKQDIQPKALELTALNKIYYHLKKVFLEGNFKIIIVKTEKNNYVAAALVFKDFDDVIHVPVVGVGDTKYGGSLLYQAIITWACDVGGKLIDFNGANSPQRAYFKHSFGGYSEHFFHVSYQDTKY